MTRILTVDDSRAVRTIIGKTLRANFDILEAEDGEKIVIPNKHFVGEIHRDSPENRVIEGQTGIAYSSDVDEAITVVRGAVSGIDGVSDKPAQVGINSFGDSSINIDYRVWVRTDRYITTLHALNCVVFKALGDAGIAIPFPQREVRVLSDS